MSFYPGQRVVCIDDSNITETREPLKKGTVYTVRECSVSDGEEGVYLEEIVNFNRTRSGLELGYLSWRFRPLDESRLDVFRQMLATHPKQKVKA